MADTSMASSVASRRRSSISNPSKRSKRNPYFKKKNEKYRHGSYNTWEDHPPADSKLNQLIRDGFSRRPDLLSYKVILDIGCNVGTITRHIAKYFPIKGIVGIDIDDKLIDISIKNIKREVHQVEFKSNIFPISMGSLYGFLNPSGLPLKLNEPYPHNIIFCQRNYVLEDDSQLEAQKPMFDTILCLAVTKWIHLNYGDEALKRCFRRMYQQLRTGGVLILEPQTWNSYKRKRFLTKRIYENFTKNIKFRPEQFLEYLESIGFVCEEFITFTHPTKGFKRPIYLCVKEIKLFDSMENQAAKRAELRRRLAQEKTGPVRQLWPRRVHAASPEFYEDLENQYFQRIE